MSQTSTGGAHRLNNFDFLRHIAAFLVIYGHSQALVGIPYQRLWGTPVSVMGVVIFFALSGYLVSESWQRDPRLVSFFTKRGLRIFPPLIVCVLLSAFVLGPLLTRLPPAEYFSNPHFVEYLKNIILLIRYNLPGVFETNIYPHAINGSLWSLPVEFFCYIAVSAMGLGYRKLGPITVFTVGAIVCGAGFYLNLFYRGPQLVVWGTDVQQAFSVMPFFFVGSLLCALKGKIPLRLDVALVLVFGLFAIEGLGLNYMLMVGCWLALPYIVLSFGTAATPILRHWGRFGDMSYGMYLYAFPVQQTLVYLFKNSISAGVLTVYATVVSVAIAFVSWHLIEKRALLLKPRARPNLSVVPEPLLDRAA